MATEVPQNLEYRGGLSNAAPLLEDEEEVSSYDNEMVEVKVLMALAEDNEAVSKEGARNGEWVKISMRKVYALLEMEVCSTSLPSLEKLAGAELVSGPKTIKLILKLNSTFKAEALKGVIINEPSSALTKGNKSASASKVNSAPAGKLKNVKIENDPPLAIVVKELNNLKLQISKNQSSYSRNNQPQQIISLRRRITPRNPQLVMKSCETCGSTVQTTTDHNDIEWFIRGEELQAKKAEALKSTKCDVRKLIWYLDSGCSRHMTGVKSYLHKYVEQPGPKVVFGDDSTCTTEGYGSIKCNGIVFTKVAFVNGLKYNLISISQLCDAKYIVQFGEKRGTIFNSNKEVVMIASRIRDVYVFDMTSSTQESCFFAKAFENLNWLWHKRLAHLNFKTINKLAKQNLVIGLPHLSIQRINHVHHVKRENIIGPASKQNIHLLSRNVFIFFTWIYLDHILVNLCDEKGISQNFSFPYTPEQNGVAERKNRTLIEAARTMLSGSVFSKQYWTAVVATACYTQNRSTIVKRRKFDEKTNDGYFLGYSLISKAFKVFNTRRQQTEETYHIIFDESPNAIKFTTPSVDNINIAESKRYPPDEYLHPYEPSQRYQTNNNDLSFIEPYECPEPVVLETKVPFNQNGQADQNDHNDQSVQTDEILNNDQSEHSNHTNDEQLIISQALKIFRSLNTYPFQM
ncbi:retrovirus-related pol polyprotein from transposon TNT 1-94 [Tanacetum coccineum]|uniref:Retrovirus-related pol polyprotein from transposon TNT 1-94 n=1 Tax=Tanacetum coccineum TaxID=301880 RepID=A0ABQ4WNL6_9ASTR